MTEKRNVLLDIVIPVYNRFDLLEKCLAAIPDACGDISYNTVLVDNNSEKEPADAFYKTLIGNETITLIRNRKNLGFPKACNIGAQRKKAPLILFLNSDVILEPGSIQKLVMNMDNPEVGVAGMLLLFPSHQQMNEAQLNIGIRPAGTVQHVGLVTNIRGDFEHVFMGWDADHKKVRTVRDIHAVTGAAMLVRRNQFIRVRGFDEAYGGGTWEDVDYCMKIHELGYNVIVDVDAVGIHYTSATVEATQMGFPIQENKMLFMNKWQQKLKYTEWKIR